jgi:hypothetical protein
MKWVCPFTDRKNERHIKYIMAGFTNEESRSVYLDT